MALVSLTCPSPRAPNWRTLKKGASETGAAFCPPNETPAAANEKGKAREPDRKSLRDNFMVDAELATQPHKVNSIHVVLERGRLRPPVPFLGSSCSGTAGRGPPRSSVERCQTKLR